MTDLPRAWRSMFGAEQRSAGHDMLYHRVLDALGAHGCPICRLRSEAVQRYLDGLLYEQVNDPGLRKALAGSRGFCAAHAWDLLRLGDSLGVAILYKDQVARALEDITQAARGTDPGRGRNRRSATHPGGNGPAQILRQRRAPQAPCPACQIAEEAESRYLTTLIEHLADPELSAAIERSPFLCLPDLVRALDRVRAPGQARTLLHLAEAKLTHLHEELAELIRKRHYRFRHEPRGTEQTSWSRAVGQLVGWLGSAGRRGHRDQR